MKNKQLSLFGESPKEKKVVIKKRTERHGPKYNSRKALDLLFLLCKEKGTDITELSKYERKQELTAGMKIVKNGKYSYLDIVSCIQWLSKQQYATNLSMALVSVKIDFFIEWRKSVASVLQKEKEPVVFVCNVEPIKPVDFDAWKEKRELSQQKMEQYLKDSGEAYARSKKEDSCKAHTPEDAAELMKKIYGGKD